MQIKEELMFIFYHANIFTKNTKKMHFIAKIIHYFWTDKMKLHLLANFGIEALDDRVELIKSSLFFVQTTILDASVTNFTQ